MKSYLLYYGLLEFCIGTVRLPFEYRSILKFINLKLYCSRCMNYSVKNLTVLFFFSYIQVSNETCKLTVTLIRIHAIIVCDRFSKTLLSIIFLF